MAGCAQTKHVREEEERARDPRDTEAVISSLIMMRNDCNESETGRRKEGKT